VYYAAQTDKIPILIVEGHALDEFGIQHFRIVEGQALARRGQVLLGRKAAEAAGIHVGNSLSVGNMEFKVMGLFETGVLLEDMNGAVVPLRDAQALAGKTR
jgi:ABC-type lipoprotein release transport system permease subunit